MRGQPGFLAVAASVCRLVCVLWCAAYLTSSVNPHHTELMAAVETLSVDKDRDVQYIMSAHLDPESSLQ